MVQAVAAVREKVARQKIDIPAMYGAIDFELRPERFANETGSDSVLKNLPAELEKLFAKRELIERLEA